MPDDLYDPDNDYETNEAWLCLDCSVHTGKIGEYYIIEDEVWELAEVDEGMLCIGCLEVRIGRELVPSDFPDYPINDGVCFDQSDRLAARLGLS